MRALNPGDELDELEPDAPPSAKQELFDEDEGEASSRIETSLVLSAASFGLSLAGPVFPLAQLLSAPVLLVSTACKSDAAVVPHTGRITDSLAVLWKRCLPI